MTCLACGFEDNTENAQFCQGCGKSLLSECEYCGNKDNLVGAVFCQGCGKKLISTLGQVFGTHSGEITKKSVLYAVITIPAGIVAVVYFLNVIFQWID